MKLRMQVSLGPGHIVLDGYPAPPKRGTAPHFSAHVDRFGQTAGWIKMPLGMEVDLGPGHIVLDGDPAPPERGTAAPSLFGPRDCSQTIGHLSYYGAVVRVLRPW